MSEPFAGEEDAVTALAGAVRSGRVTLHFDGGARPNPGRIEIAVVIAGRALVRSDCGDGDNATAEWLALCWAAELAARAGVADVLFVGDSLSVVEQARGRWPCRNPAMRRHLDTFRASIAGIARVTLRHVPRSKNLAGIALARRHPR